MFTFKSSGTVAVCVACLIASGTILAQGTSNKMLPKYEFFYSPMHNSVLVHGTWRGAEKGAQGANNTATIECRRTVMECVEASVDVDRVGRLDAILITRRKVTTWEGHRIVVLFDEWTCDIEIDEIDISARRVVRQRTRKAGKDPELCKALTPALPSKQILGEPI